MHHSRGNAELNYRRFFAVTTLAGVRVEDPRCFEATHALVRQWPAAGVTGLRIDHPDGLVDPAEYLDRLRATRARGLDHRGEDPGGRRGAAADWPVAGTTGYDAMREVNGVFVDPDGEAELTALYPRLTGDQRTDRRARRAGQADGGDDAAARRGAPDGRPGARGAGCRAGAWPRSRWPSRSTAPTCPTGSSSWTRPWRRRRPPTRAGRDPGRARPRLHDPADELARRMQQLSGATMAKGVEDTAYYRYARFIALNEVGGDPGQFGIPLAEFHALQARRQAGQPESMTGLSTHDTKRGEDVRARLAVLAEIVEEWAASPSEFLPRPAVPNRAFGYFLAQTLVGAGPIERDRMHAYAEKAMREAGDGTTWTEPDADFEAAVHAAVDLAYDDAGLRGAWDELDRAGHRPGLGQRARSEAGAADHAGSPGRLPGHRGLGGLAGRPGQPAAGGLRRGCGTCWPGLTRRRRSTRTGAAKLWVTAAALRARRDRPELFTGYTPVSADGPAAGPPGRLRPRRGHHPGHPAADRPGPVRWLG